MVEKMDKCHSEGFWGGSCVDWLDKNLQSCPWVFIGEKLDTCSVVFGSLKQKMVVSLLLWSWPSLVLALMENDGALEGWGTSAQVI